MDIYGSSRIGPKHRAKLARRGHDIAWEFEKPGGGYTGRMLIDGEIYTPREATKTFLKVQKPPQERQKNGRPVGTWRRKRPLCRPRFEQSLLRSPSRSKVGDYRVDLSLQSRALAEQKAFRTVPCL